MPVSVSVRNYILILQPGLIKWCTSVHFLCDKFYVPYCPFRRSFKEKCPLSGDKTQVKYVNPGTFLLHRYRNILLCFYYDDTETYCGGSEFKYPGSVPKNVCSIVLEICPTQNPTLNLPDSVNKCKTYIKMYLLMQLCHLNFLICRFKLLCGTMITRDSSWSSSSPKYVSVLRELPNKLTVYENPRYDAGYVWC